MADLQFCGRRWIPCLLLAGAGIFAGSGCREQGARPAPPPPDVVVSTPLKRQIVEWDEYVGRFEAIEFVEVRSRVNGYLERTSFVEGQIVEAGDLLAVIDRRPFEAEVNRTKALLAQAKAQVGQSAAAVLEAEAAVRSAKVRQDLAQRNVERWRTLVERNAGTQEDLDTREAELQQSEANMASAKAALEAAKAEQVAADAAQQTAQANLEAAELNLGYTEIRAPVKGRISRRIVTEGNLIDGGSSQSTLITTIVSLDPIHITFDADEAAFLKYVRLAAEGKRASSREVRNPVYVALADEPETFPHRGHMDFVENRLDLETGTIRGRAILPNPDLALTPGLFGRVRLPGSATYEAILIPDLAIGTDQSQKFVWIVGADGTVSRQVVTLGPIVHGLRVIRTGLNGGEQILVRGQQRVRPGVRVKATSEPVVPMEDGLPDEYQPVPPEEWLSPARGPAANVWVPMSLRDEVKRLEEATSSPAEGVSTIEDERDSTSAGKKGTP